MSEHHGTPVNHPSRRDVLKAGAAVGLGLAIARPAADLMAQPSPMDYPWHLPPMAKVRIGFVGVGGMGSVHVDNLLAIPGAELVAICDVVPEKVTRIQDLVVSKGFARPTGYSNGPRDFERMCQQPDIDLVYTATPWEWHAPIMLAAMNAGKHTVTEVPMCTTMEECWQLLETSERTGKLCLMMENCVYDRPEMLCLNLVRLGLLGEVLHGEGGYLHDLREIKFSDSGEGLWRRAHAVRRNANLYPTHGLGPIAQCMDINRGDRFDYLVSMSSNSRGLRAYAAEHFPPGHPKRDEYYSLGDINTTLIKTVKGKTIILGHNCDNPRPYSRVNIVQGTKGIFEGYPNRVMIEGRSPNHRWEELSAYYEEFEHPLWKDAAVQRATTGHGGMDFLEDQRLIQALIAGEPTDYTIWDGLAWSAITPLTEQSVANRSMPVPIPDFTRGRWEFMPPMPVHTPRG
ncbi:MAG: Gfo/Idh/MocA family oxidoreductase [Gemmatimonadota bacterium]|nr:Gfo/Idh/MocA family oxidoreductase [Gemmatimonadota bacterium]